MGKKGIIKKSLIINLSIVITACVFIGVFAFLTSGNNNNKDYYSEKMEAIERESISNDPSKIGEQNVNIEGSILSEQYGCNREASCIDVFIDEGYGTVRTVSGGRVWLRPIINFTPVNGFTKFSEGSIIT